VNLRGGNGRSSQGVDYRLSQLQNLLVGEVFVEPLPDLQNQVHDAARHF
jgi:hypothetical protein